MKRQREWNYCPIEATERTAERFARSDRLAADARRFALLPDVLLDWLVEVVLPAVDGYMREHIWASVSDAMDVVTQRPEIRAVARRYREDFPVELERFAEAAR